MRLPSDPVQKTLSNPRDAYRWIRRNFIQAAAEGFYTRRHARYPFGEDWDILIVLDACRYDLAVEASPNDWGEPERAISPGWNSKTWIDRVFSHAAESALSETIYITANPYSPRVDQDELQLVDEVWKYAFDEELGTIPPRPLTDRTIQHHRATGAERLIVHYMQPHLPPVNRRHDLGLQSDGMAWRNGNPWVLIESDQRDPAEIVPLYRDNLTPVLDEVELLLENVDAETVVVTADHGNYLGESGHWGHHNRFARDSAVRAVPWWELTATDEHTHEPSEYEHEAGVDRGEQLAALGYG